MVFLTFTVPPLLMPPPWPGKKKGPPLGLFAVLPEMVELVIVTLPPWLYMPPPLPATVLPEMVELVTVSVPLLYMPPPPPPTPPSALLPAIVELLIVIVPTLLLKMPPPIDVELPEIAHPVTVKIPLLWLRMPPPPAASFPLVIVKPEMVTLEAKIPKMRKSVLAAALRCTVNRFAPGPLIVRLLSIDN